MKNTLHRSFQLFFVVAIGLLLIGRSGHAQTIWDGNGTPDSSGAWNVSSNWSTDLVPSGVAVQLNDVTSGTRTISLDTTSSSVTSLNMTQSTVGATNALNISGVDLTLTSTGTAFNQTLTGGAMTVSIVSGGSLTFATSGASKTMNNAGTLNLGDASTGGSIVARNTSTSNTTGANLTINNSGTINSYNSSSITRSTAGSATANQGITLTLANSSTGTVAVKSGTMTMGSTTVASNNSSNKVDNSGTFTIENGATFAFAGLTTGGANFTSSFANNAGGNVRIGSATTAGQGNLVNTSGTATDARMVITNSGTMSVYGTSQVGMTGSGTAASAQPFLLTNESGGVLNLVGDATGVKMGIISVGTNPGAVPTLVNNAGGTVNVSVFTDSATGVTTFGMNNSGNQRAGATVTNAGQFNIDPNATFIIQGRRSPTDSVKAITYTNASGGNLVLGTNGSTTTGGALEFNYTASATGTPTVTTGGATFTNSGTTTLYGTSAIRMKSGSSTSAEATTVPIYIDNTATGVLNLYDTSSVGQTTKATAFSNEGLLAKYNSGTATVASNASGTALNTGTIYVKAGELNFDSSLDTSASTAILKLDIGASSAGLLSTDGTLTLGDAGAALQLNFLSASLSSSYNLLDFTSLSGTFSSITLSGSGFSGSFSSTSFTSNGYNFTLDYATGILTATTVPEPETYALLFAGVGLLVAVTRLKRTVKLD